MTTPTPGWYSDPDPSNAGGQRFWDGGQWTNQSAPGKPPPPPPTPSEPTPGGQNGGNRGLKIFLAIAAAIVLVVGLGSVFGLGDEEKDESDQASATSSESPTSTTTTRARAAVPSAAPRTTAAPSVTTTAASAPSTTSAAVPPPAAFVSDPRCAPANQSLVDQVASGFSESGLILTNGTVIDAGDYTYVGGTTIDSTGRVENRSDVWVISGGAVYASTGGARNTTTWPRASSELGVSPGDPDVQALDTCVVNLTR